MSYATGRCMCNAHLRHPFTVEHVTQMVRHVYGERVTFHSGDGDIGPGITVHRVGGHSDGLQVVRVETERGPVVLASDASHYYANLHRRSPFPIVYNIGDMATGWETVERLAGHPDRFIPGHDPIVCEIYPRASDKVDAFALHKTPSRSFVKEK
jgi:glyoxylase-like metal-dependent hydrolase (beta-lactamase superfamily II)